MRPAATTAGLLVAAVLMAAPQAVATPGPVSAVATTTVATTTGGARPARHRVRLSVTAPAGVPASVTIAGLRRASAPSTARCSPGTASG